MTSASARGVRISGVSAQQWYEGPSHRIPVSVLVEFIITTHVKTYANVGRIAGIPQRSDCAHLRTNSPCACATKFTARSHSLSLIMYTLPRQE